MLIAPRIDPVAVQLGPFAIHWYGIMYLLAFAVWLLLARRQLRYQVSAGPAPGAVLTAKDLEEMLFLGIWGVILGGRLGYVFFYKPELLRTPFEIFAIWQGGMSFHGGMIGVVLSQLWFARSRRKPFWRVMDLIAPAVPPGLAAGRIGNFLNGELWGRPADPSLPWAVVFPQSGSMVPRHPSQLYAALLEGIVLFLLLWLYARAHPREGRVSAAFLIGYGLLRYVGEYFREPDAHLGLQALGLSRGQWLSVPLVLAGAVLWAWAGRKPSSRV